MSPPPREGVIPGKMSGGSVRKKMSGDNSPGVGRYGVWSVGGGSTNPFCSATPKIPFSGLVKLGQIFLRVGTRSAAPPPPQPEDTPSALLGGTSVGGGERAVSGPTLSHLLPHWPWPDRQERPRRRSTHPSVQLPYCPAAARIRSLIPIRPASSIQSLATRGHEERGGGVQRDGGHGETFGGGPS